MHKTSYTIEPTQEKDFPTITLTSESGHKVYLHSRISPSKETSAIHSSNYSSSIDTIISIGSGFGYHLLPFITNSSIQNIIIIDILEGLESDFIKHSIMTRYMVNIKTVFICGKETSAIDDCLNEVLSVESVSKILIVEHAASVRAFPEYYSCAKETVEKNIRRQAGNLITKKAFSSLYVRNCIKMLPYLPSFFPFASLENKFTDYSCVIISSAPSIDTYIEILKKHENRFFIIAVDSAYPILRAHGIIPDFVLTIDPQPWTEEHLMNISPEIPVITTLSAWNHTKHPKTSFMSLNTHPFCQIIDHTFPGIGSIDSKSGTVAGDALYAAHEMGFSKIILAGIDFSFPKELIYSKDSKYNQRYTSIFNKRIMTTETLNISYVRKSPKRIIEEKVKTRQSFLQFRDSFEKNIQQKNIKNVYLLRDNGLSIKNSVELNNAAQILSFLSELRPISNKMNITAAIIEKSKKLSSRFSVQDIQKLFVRHNMLETAFIESMPSEIIRKKHSKYQLLITSLLEGKL